MTKVLTMREAMQALIDGKKITILGKDVDFFYYLEKDGGITQEFDSGGIYYNHGISGIYRYTIYEEPSEYFDFNTAMKKVFGECKVYNKNWNEENYISAFCFAREVDMYDSSYGEKIPYVVSLIDYQSEKFYVKNQKQEKSKAGNIMREGCYTSRDLESLPQETQDKISKIKKLWVDKASTLKKENKND